MIISNKVWKEIVDFVTENKNSLEVVNSTDESTKLVRIETDLSLGLSKNGIIQLTFNDGFNLDINLSFDEGRCEEMKFDSNCKLETIETREFSIEKFKIIIADHYQIYCDS